MPWQGWVVLLVIICAFVLLFMEKGPPDQIMLGALCIVWALGIVNSSEAISGFGSTSPVTIGALFIVVHGVDKSKVLNRGAQRVLGNTGGQFCSRVKLCLIGFSLSGFLNNTPLVALLLPIVRDWARRRNFAASKFLIPLSYSTIMGGLLTTIGTSTNLLVQDLMSQNGLQPFGFFDPAKVSLPVGIVALTYLLFIAYRCLPDNRGGLFRELRENRERLITQLQLTADFPLLGQSVFKVLHKWAVPPESLLEVMRPISSAGKISTTDPRTIIPLPVNDSDRSIPSSTDSTDLEETEDDDDEGCCASWWPFTDAEDEDGEEEGNGDDEVDMHSSASGYQVVSVANNAQTDRLTRYQSWGLNVPHAGALSTTQGARLEVAHISPVPEYETAEVGDILVLSVDQDELIGLFKRRRYMEGVQVQFLPAVDLAGGSLEFVELVLAPRSPLVGRSLHRGREVIENTYRGARLVAYRKRGANTEGLQLGRSSSNHGRFAEQLASDDNGTDGSSSEDESAGNRLPTGSPASGGTGQFSAGDTVLVLAPLGVEFPKSDFLLVTRIGVLPKPLRCYDYLPLPMFGIGLILAALGLVPMVQVSVTLAVIFVLGGWVEPREIREVVDWYLLILIGSALGLSLAVVNSGLSTAMANLVKAARLPPWGALIVLFFVTLVTTELITNNAAAALGLPLAIDLSNELGLATPDAFCMTVMLAASTSYAIPIGYATNLMVMGPGGYTFIDFLKVGTVMDLIYLVGCSLLVPIWWPLDMTVATSTTSTTSVFDTATNRTRL